MWRQLVFTKPSSIQDSVGRRKGIRYQKQAIFALIAGGLAVAFNYPRVTAGFDAHHQGLMLASAMGVTEGLSLHGEVFSQYGPITTWSQAIFLSLSPASPAIALNLWSLSIIALSAIGLTLLSVASRRNLRITPESAFLGAITWVLLSPEFALGEILAWSSLLAALVGISLTLLVIFGLGGGPSNPGGNTAWFAAGFLVGLMPFIRLNVGAVLAILVLAWVVAALTFKWVKASQVGWAFLGGTLSIASVAAVLGTTRSLEQYWLQSVIGPLSWAQGGSSFSKVVEEVGEDVYSLAPRALPFMLAGLILVAILGPRAKKTREIWLVWIIGTGLMSLGMMYASALHTVLSPAKLMTGGPFKLPSDALSDALFFFVFLGIILTAVYGLLRAKKAFERLSAPPLAAACLIVIVAASLLFQYWPTLADRQLWWGAPILMVLFFHSTERVLTVSILRFWVVPVAILALVSALTLDGSSADKSSLGPMESPFGGLRVDDETLAYFEGTGDLYAKTLEPGELVFISVIQGSDVIADGTYRASNSIFSSWAQDSNVRSHLFSWDGKSVVDALSLEKLGVKTFSDLESSYNLKTLGCSSIAYTSEWPSDTPYLCVLAPAS